jgi:hypothetical protein
MNVTILDNKNLEDKLTLDKQYEVKDETTGDFYDYYLLLCDDGSKHWVEKYRVAESKSRAILEEMGLEKLYPNTKDCEHLYKCNSGTALPHDFLYVKSLSKMPVTQPTERIICIPDENGHIVDLQRVQYISPLDDKKEDKPYSVTLVSGWEMKLTDKLYSREKLIGLWRALQNK